MSAQPDSQSDFMLHRARRRQTHSVEKFRGRAALWLLEELFTDVIIFFGEANQEQATGHGLAYFSFTPRLHRLSLLILPAGRDDAGPTIGGATVREKIFAFSAPLRRLGGAVAASPVCVFWQWLGMRLTVSTNSLALARGCC